MTRLTDDELARHLERRLRANPLEGEPRHELLTAISDGARAMPRRRLALAWQRMRWLGAAGAAVAFVLVAVLALPPRGLTPGPSPTSSPSIDILTESQLAALAADPTAVGTVVIGRAAIAFATCYGECPDLPPVTLGGYPSVAITGLLDDTRGEYFAFRVQPNSLFLLGRVELNGDQPTWTVADVLGRPAADLGDRLLAVDGWLVQAPAHSCRPSTLDDRFACGREAYVTPTERQIAARGTGDGLSIEFPSDGLRVQNNAYDDFALEPVTRDFGITEPRRGTYLVRWAGCQSEAGPTPEVSQPPTDSPDCSFWEIAGRLDPLAPDSTQAIATPTPAVPPSPAATRWSVLNAKALAAAANDPASYGTVVIADVEFGVRQPEGYVVVQHTSSEVVVTHLDPVQAVAGVYAFRVWSGEVETLGRVTLRDGGQAWTVDEIRALPDLSGEEPVDLYPVRAWLVGGASTPEEAWLTTDRFEPVGAVDPPGDAITLQEGAYVDLALNPQANDRGTTEPRLAVYLIRPGDCTGGDTCPAQLVGVLDPPTPHHPTGLTLAGDAPIRLVEAPGSWYGYRVRMCNETSNYTDFVGEDARLLLADGELVRAGHQPGPLDAQLDLRLDAATVTLAPDACAEGWLVFGTSSEGMPARIQWHGRVLQLDPVENTPGGSGNLPTEIDGQPVLTGDDIRTHIAAATDDSPFLIGGLISFVSVDCWIPDDFPLTPLLAPCNDGYVLGEFGAINVKLVVGLEDVGISSQTLAVLRVHVNDSRAADCPPAYRDRCARAVVVEDVLWSQFQGATFDARATGTVSGSFHVGYLLTMVIEPGAWSPPADWEPSERDPHFGFVYSTMDIDRPLEGGPATLLPGDYTVAVFRAELNDVDVDVNRYLLVEELCTEQMSLDEATVAVQLVVHFDHFCTIEFDYSPPLPRGSGNLPTEIDGEPVFVGHEMLLRGADGSDDTPLLIGGVIFFSPGAMLANCPSGEPPAHVLAEAACSGEPGWALDSGSVGMMPVVVPDDLVWSPPAESEALRVVLQVHVNDQRSADCPPEYAGHCAWMKVVEKVVWSAPFP